MKPSLLLAGDQRLIIELDSAREQQTFSQQLEYLPTKPGNQLSLNQVRGLVSEHWYSLNLHNLNFGFTTDVYWFRTRFRSEQDFNAIIEMDRPYLDEVDFYFIDSEGGLTHFQLGDNMSYAMRPLPTTNIQVPFSYRAGEVYDFYLRVNTNGFSMMLQLDIWQEKAAAYHDNLYFLGYSALFVGAIIIALYNLFVGLATRDPAY